ncbi:beta-ketothiolase BktB [Yanghanlia caeni]|uniref:Acetyl-CoA C-acyltransferase family protein n=1 Tax=Yanghanlia caeni TaxID=3064283 RepID=A0ABU1D5Y3_9BURK|nr:acetyl-CoA C-acyltransferase family protein [Alcaligenaceae bacterium LG-2]NGR06475.1 acetyl-CoA C-acyltransferase family protein [bacterium SGD-2]HZH57629.1 acetyl-CoA C-acyltransferase family protein [Burkholderiaceae bacterium]
MEEVVVVAACRTAVGDFGGALKDVPPTELGATVVRAVLERGGVPAADVGQVVFGHVINTEPRDMYLSRVASVNAGIPHESVAMNVNRLCGSGLQAIISAAQAIKLGDTKIAIGAGAESMSRSPYIAPAQRWGARMGDAALLDMMTGALSDPFDRVHMGVTAENVAKRYGVTRQDQDELALASHQRAENAIKNGYFKSQIVPVVQKTRKGEVVFDTDEHVRMGATIENFSGLRPVFVKEDGTVTAGNASAINDGAGAVLLMSASEANARGIKPMARLVAYAHAGVEPLYMGIGPVPATRLVLERAGITADQLDVIEANEAFAAQACAVTRELGLDPAKVNPNGSGISLGHPIGATGAIITTKALYELERIQGRYALVTMCIGGGQGIAAVFERV